LRLIKTASWLVEANPLRLETMSWRSVGCAPAVILEDELILDQLAFEGARIQPLFTLLVSQGARLTSLSRTK
jgi:hypothetical protein